MTVNSVNTYIVPTAANEVTMPSQPAFRGQKNITAANVTGDNTAYVVVGYNEIFDQNADFNPVTGVFTAPVTGLYMFNATFSIQDLTAAHTSGRFFINVAAFSHEIYNSNSGAERNNDNDLTITGSGLFTMTAGQTAWMVLVVRNGAKVVDVQDTFTAFSGWLVV